MNHGSQVTIVRQQLLPMIREKQQWSMDTCVNKVIPLKPQPIGATGQKLGAIGIAILDILVDTTDKTCSVSCYVLDSSQPLWLGEMEDCGVLMGTNALVKHGFTVTHSNGMQVEPNTKDRKDPNGNTNLNATDAGASEQALSSAVVPDELSSRNSGGSEQVTRVILSQVVHLGAQQTKEVKVEIVCSSENSEGDMLGVLVPVEETLAEQQCDFTQALW